MITASDLRVGNWFEASYLSATGPRIGACLVVGVAAEGDALRLSVEWSVDDADEILPTVLTKHRGCAVQLAPITGTSKHAIGYRVDRPGPIGEPWTVADQGILTASPRTYGDDPTWDQACAYADEQDMGFSVFPVRLTAEGWQRMPGLVYPR